MSSFVHSQMIRLNTSIRLKTDPRSPGMFSLKKKKKNSTRFQFIGTFLRLWSMLDMMHIRQYDHITLQLNIILHNSKYHNEKMIVDLYQHVVVILNNYSSKSELWRSFDTLWTSHGETDFMSRFVPCFTEPTNLFQWYPRLTTRIFHFLHL